MNTIRRSGFKAFPACSGIQYQKGIQQASGVFNEGHKSQKWFQNRF